MKQLYVVKDVTKYEDDVSSYIYIVKANDYKEAIEIVKEKTGITTFSFDAELADNDEVWE